MRKERKEKVVRLGLMVVVALLGAATAEGKSSGLAVTTNATVVARYVRGTVVITNSTSKALAIASIRTVLEVRYPSGVLPPLPTGSSSDSYVVATAWLPPPGVVPAGATVSVPYSVDTCGGAVASYRGAKDMRHVVTVVAGSTTASARSANFTPPSQSACPVCGNRIVEAGEQCDGGACCSSTCQPAVDGAVCSDGNACTRTDRCQAGRCAGGDPLQCAASSQCHAAGSCNPSTGLCSNPPLPTGTTCDDGNACSTTDACASGRCLGAPMDCDDGNVCTSDACSAGDCVHTDNSAPCDDDNVCTDGDTCDGGGCFGGAPRDCDDHQACTDDACDEATECTHAPAPVCDGCHADECVVCQEGCAVAQEECATGCWNGFWSCVSGCTTTYCAPFCQADLGQCLGACPAQAVCEQSCEAGNGCDQGCVTAP